MNNNYTANEVADILMTKHNLSGPQSVRGCIQKHLQRGHLKKIKTINRPHFSPEYVYGLTKKGSEWLHREKKTLII